MSDTAAGKREIMSCHLNNNGKMPRGFVALDCRCMPALPSLQPSKQLFVCPTSGSIRSAGEEKILGWVVVLASPL